MEDNMKLSTPEDDEDLEALRLAALQSLKRKAHNEMQPLGQYVQEKKHFNGSPHGKQKRKPYTRSAQTRTSRNGLFNGWVRNSNLIAVPMVNEESKSKEEKSADDIPKLVLPQHRYCKLDKSPEKQETQSSKFDRYDNSDQSDDESEEDDSCKSDEEKNELKRANSLEELMAELENEIQGVSSKVEEKPKPKMKKKRKVSIVEEAKPEPKIETTVLKENLKPESETKKPVHNFRQRKWQKPRRHNPPPPPPNYLPPVPLPEIIQPIVAFAPPPVQAFSAFNPIAYDGIIYTPPLYEAPPPPMMPIHMVPPTYERPRSPLGIADSFGSAPLSPRSAAFVMQNRAIIEKRKRRSYSRSRSPSPERSRRSKSPRRLSLSPERVVKPPRRRSFSPSPVRKVLPPKNPSSSPKKPTIHERLGTKAKEEEAKVKNEKKEDLDPVLEARRKKFERNEITMTEGVIKLKKAEEAEEKKKEEEEEEELDEDTLLGEEDEMCLSDPKLDSLFSDEESDSDNEGRFKTKQETNQKVAVLPFTKLLNGAKTEIKDGLTVEQKKNERMRRGRKRFRSRSPKKMLKNAEKPKTLFPTDRKIEIKIRNPAKYEKAEDDKSRKVEVGKPETDPSAGSEEKEDSSTANVSEGDLRAQLSRKRAERQKHPLSDALPTRLLQNALQGAGVKKLKGKKAKNNESSEGKLPIRLRLGTTPAEGVGKKRKQKNKGSQEQV